MGSCQSSKNIKIKTNPSSTPWHKSARNNYTVTTSEVSFLSHIFKELCSRNHTTKYLEKNIFLIFFPYPVNNIQGILGERLFDNFDSDKDGYITEDQFLVLIEMFTKHPIDMLIDDFFSICDLKGDQKIDKEEFLKTLHPVLKEIIKSQISTKLSIGNYLTKADALVGTMCSMMSIDPFMMFPEDFAEKIFEKHENGMLKKDFSLFLSSHQQVLNFIKKGLRVESWNGGVQMKIKISKNVSSHFSGLSPNVAAILTEKNESVPVNLLFQDNFLVIFDSKKNIKTIVFTESCKLKNSDFSVRLFYFTQIEERMSLRFETNEIKDEFIEAFKCSNQSRKFKDYYKINHRIGEGKFSVVFNTTNIETNSRYAVKVIKKESLTRLDRETYRKEIAIIKEAEFEGVISIKDFFESRKSIKIVTELIEGGELINKMNSNNKSEDFIKVVTRKLLETVKYLNSLGIMHRDLKPDNVLIEEGESVRVKLIDFGLSTYFLPGEHKKYKCGTLGYMAPEVLRGDYTEKADLWSIGIVIYAYVTGKLPFFSYSRNEFLHVIETTEPDFKHSNWKDFSEKSLEFTKILLNKNQELRPDCERALSHPWFSD